MLNTAGHSATSAFFCGVTHSQRRGKSPLDKFEARARTR